MIIVEDVDVEGDDLVITIVVVLTMVMIIVEYVDVEGDGLVITVVVNSCGSHVSGHTYPRIDPCTTPCNAAPMYRSPLRLPPH